MKRYEILFKGRVQSVGFRYTSKLIADKLNLTGTVENLNDGNVKCFIQGNDDSIDRFLNELNNNLFIIIDSCKKIERDVIEEEKCYKIIG